MIGYDEARRLALGGSFPQQVIPYGGGWVFFPRGLPGRGGPSATIVSDDGRWRRIIRRELDDVVTAVAAHHGMAVEDALTAFPLLANHQPAPGVVAPAG